jgi:Ca2+:H+ antiporter
MRWQWPMLAFVPISVLLAIFHAPPVWIFLCSCLAIVPLAGLMGHATEELAKYRGQAIGGLMNATFGNATELIIAIVAVMNGEVDVVRASLIGSIVGNLLLVLGLSALLGGLKFKEQQFSKDAAGTHSSMMTIAVISLLVPAIFVRSVPHIHEGDVRVESLSLWVGAVLIALYIFGLVFALRTHQSAFVPREEEAHEPPTMKQSQAILMLLASTIVIAVESELLVHSIGPVVQVLHMSKLFLGIILIPIIGNAAEHSTAVTTAIKNKMDISLNIAVSSATQIAMFVAPIIIFVSAVTTSHVTILFSNVELITVVVAVVITGQVTRDGKTNWLEGAQLLAAYIIIALAFFYIPAHT